MQQAELPLFRDFSAWMRQQFPYKVQKISLHAGFTCPNRDGRVGLGGCTYCNNQTFNPAYCQESRSITQQLEEGRAFFSHKYPEMKYLAYFQAYTNTYDTIEMLDARYQEALAVDDVVGVVIGTRPDCVDERLLDYFADLHKSHYVLLEYGIESCYDKTLELINRGHTFAQSAWAVQQTAQRGIPVGGHMILGLPGESHDEILNEASILSDLPLDTIKLHQLQLIKGTKMARQQELNPDFVHLYDVDEYIDLVIEFIARLRPDLVVERFVSQSPADLLIAPKWGLKNYAFVDKVKKRMRERAITQGCLYHP